MGPTALKETKEIIVRVRGKDKRPREEEKVRRANLKESQGLCHTH
jgi:hypothetical protein